MLAARRARRRTKGGRRLIMPVRFLHNHIRGCPRPFDRLAMGVSDSKPVAGRKGRTYNSWACYTGSLEQIPEAPQGGSKHPAAWAAPVAHPATSEPEPTHCASGPFRRPDAPCLYPGINGRRKGRGRPRRWSFRGKPAQMSATRRGEDGDNAGDPMGFVVSTGPVFGEDGSCPPDRFE
jgi:hypothetical protein